MIVVRNHINRIVMLLECISKVNCVCVCVCVCVLMPFDAVVVVCYLLAIPPKFQADSR